LYLPAVVATRFNPDMKAKYDQLVASGKCKKLAITGCSICAAIAGVSHQGMTSPAPLPFFGQIAPKMYAHLVRWS